MEILVLSDSHGHTNEVQRILDARPDVDTVLFLGDGMRDIDLLEDAYPARRFYSVRGNCDMGSFAATEGLAPFGGALVLYTHGHLYEVKRTLDALAYAARKKGAEVALYGHTHSPACEMCEGILLCNPGAVCARPACYGVLTIGGGQATFALQTLQQP